ncbi:MAG: effector-associated domain EAD1-containing protein [Candidatus Promineifilaceae bacterium]
MKWNNSWNKEFHKALLSAFDQASLEQMLALELQKTLSNLVNTSAPTKKIALDLIEVAEREGWAFLLLKSARNTNPGNNLLASFADKIGIESLKVRSIHHHPPNNLERIYSRPKTAPAKLRGDKWSLLATIVFFNMVVSFVIILVGSTNAWRGYEVWTPEIAATAPIGMTATIIPTSVNTLTVTSLPVPTITPTESATVIPTVDVEKKLELSHIRHTNVQENTHGIEFIVWNGYDFRVAIKTIAFIIEWDWRSRLTPCILFDGREFTSQNYSVQFNSQPLKASVVPKANVVVTSEVSENISTTFSSTYSRNGCDLISETFEFEIAFSDLIPKTDSEEILVHIPYDFMRSGKSIFGKKMPLECIGEPNQQDCMGYEYGKLSIVITTSKEILETQATYPPIR